MTLQGSIRVMNLIQYVGSFFLSNLARIKGSWWLGLLLSSQTHLERLTNSKASFWSGVELKGGGGWPTNGHFTYGPLKKSFLIPPCFWSEQAHLEWVHGDTDVRLRSPFQVQLVWMTQIGQSFEH